MESIKTYENKDYKLEVGYDEVGYMDNPLDWGNEGTFILFHSRYSIGHKHSYTGDKSLEKRLKKEFAYIKPISMYDHSGISLYVGDYKTCMWDSGLVGYFVLTSEELESIGEDRADSYLEGYIKTYNQYLSGDIQGYRITKMTYNPEINRMEDEHIDGLCGIYDDIIYNKELLRDCLMDNSPLDKKDIDSLLN